MNDILNNDGSARTRTQLARDVYEAAREAAMKVYQAVIVEDFPPGTKVRWAIRIGKPKMDGVVSAVPGWAWSDKVTVRARTGIDYSVGAWELEKVASGVQNTAEPQLKGGA
jgi:hypothetical protein